MPGRPTIWMIVGLGPTALEVGAVGVVWTFLLSSILSLLSPSLCETARYRLKYCLKGPLNPKQPTKYSITRAYCACSRCGWGGLDIFFSHVYHFSLISPSLWETTRYRLKYCLKGPLSPKQPTNQNLIK